MTDKAIEAAEAQFLDAMAASARKLERLEQQRYLAVIRAMIAARPLDNPLTTGANGPLRSNT